MLVGIYLRSYVFFLGVELKKPSTLTTKINLAPELANVSQGSSFGIPCIFGGREKVPVPNNSTLRCAHLPCPQYAETTAVLPSQKRMGSFQTSVKSGWRGPAPGLERSHAGETHQQQDYQDARVWCVCVCFFLIDKGLSV